MKHILRNVVFVSGLTAVKSAQWVSLFHDGFETNSFSPACIPGTGNYTGSVAIGSAQTD